MARREVPRRFVGSPEEAIANLEEREGKSRDRAIYERGYQAGYHASARLNPVPDTGASLDVERLARAIDETFYGSDGAMIEVSRENARAIAAEYARLSEPVEGER